MSVQQAVLPLPGAGVQLAVDPLLCLEQGIATVMPVADDTARCDRVEALQAQRALCGVLQRELDLAPSRASMRLPLGADVLQPDANGRTPLVQAIEAGNVAACLALLECGARADVQRQGSALIEAAVHLLCYPEGPAVPEAAADILQLLLQANAHLAAGSLCLVLAAGGNDHGHRGDHVRVVELLLRAGALVDLAEPVTGRRALHYAAMRGHWRVALALLKSGADVLAHDAWGASAADYAQRFSGRCLELMAVLRAAELRALIASPSSP